MNIRDIQLLYKIKNTLGVGTIITLMRKGINNNEIHLARYNVRNKKHLREIFIPILDKYPMLTNKQYDYLRFREALLNNILNFDDLPRYTRPKEPINLVQNILDKSYFSA
jgi:ubiquinol-cytochrome c reductase cytochrome b subunit